MLTVVHPWCEHQPQSPPPEFMQLAQPPNWRQGSEEGGVVGLVGELVGVGVGPGVGVEEEKPA